MVELFQGQPCHRIHIACGDSALVALQGAHVLSWVSGGRERLFLSPANHWDGRTAIRGGIPVCFPQFNARGGLPRHGFARLHPSYVPLFGRRGGVVIDRGYAVARLLPRAAY